MASWLLFIGVLQALFCWIRANKLEGALLPDDLQAALTRLSKKAFRKLSGGATDESAPRSEALHAIEQARHACRGIWSLGELFRSRVAHPPNRETAANSSSPCAGGLAFSERPALIRVLDESLLLRVVSDRAFLSGLENVSRAWDAFSGADPAWRSLPELWTNISGPDLPSLWCRAQLVTEGTSPEKWIGIQPRPETVQVQRLHSVFVAYYSQILQEDALYSLIIKKTEETGFLSQRNLSSLLLPVQPQNHARYHGLSEEVGVALSRHLVRELTLFRGAKMPRRLSLAFPKVRYFPRAMTLAPLIEANFLNYGHWISKGLGHLAAMWSHHVGGDPHVVFLIYELPFVVDVLRLLLGDAYDTRVYLYQPDMLDFAEHVIFVGPRYFHITDNLSPEAGASIRSMLGGFLPTRTSFESSLYQPPVFLVTDRTEQNARGRRWLNFDRSLDVIRSCFEPAFTVKSYVCGHHSFTEQMAAFAEAEAVIGVDGSCLENILWMPPESVAITVIPSKTNYIPIMPV
mmetsp:Transcript_158817/g.505683  ORF Transcript_158817/g.505683 Transcript_158817/m.505683 type:complete len:517 (+) Transcript_158817:61-1611(+)